MALNPQIADITYRQTVIRKIPTANKVILVLLYVCVAIFTFLGSMWGTLMLIPSLGTLFFAWYYKGVISVSYEYQLDGYDLHIRRLSGTRSKPVDEAFAYVDLQRVIVIADQFTPEVEQGEAAFAAADRKHRVTYYTAAQDPDKPSCALYAHGSGPEEGSIVRIYLQPTAQLLHCLRQFCPGKVFTHANLI
ncbi:MAG: hypothetical protein J6M56_07535 [Clostridia bacterium]|nr:hypothetical protein [Clostridia bacterium]